MAANPAPARKLTLFLGGQLIPLNLDEVDQVLETIVNQKLASKNPALLRCCFIENVNWIQPAVGAGVLGVLPLEVAEPQRAGAAS